MKFKKKKKRELRKRKLLKKKHSCIRYFVENGQRALKLFFGLSSTLWIEINFRSPGSDYFDLHSTFSSLPFPSFLLLYAFIIHSIPLYFDVNTLNENSFLSSKMILVTCILF